MDYEEMGRRLARLRNARGLTQDTVARRLRMTRNNYQNYETGRTRIPVGQLPQIAVAFRMSKLAFMEYLGLIEKGEQTLDEFIRAEAPHLFLLTEAEATDTTPGGGKGSWRSRGHVPTPGVSSPDGHGVSAHDARANARNGPDDAELGPSKSLVAAGRHATRRRVA